MYQSDLQYKSTNELKRLIEERQTEIEWITEELDSRKNVSDELVKYADKLNALIHDNPHPYIIIKLDRKNAGPVVMVAQRVHAEVLGSEKVSENKSYLYMSASYCAVIYYSQDKKHCNVSTYDDCVYNSNYIYNPEDFLKTFKDCFVNEEDAKKVIADAVNQSCLNYYEDKKKDIVKSLNIDFKSTLFIKDAYAEHKL